MSHESIVKSMIDAAVFGTSFQSAIKEFISDYASSLSEEAIASDIAGICADFKSQSRDKETVIYSPEDKILFRKKTNNIINDVSRICREMLGYAIVNKKRSGGAYVYEAVKWEKLPPPTTLPIPPAYIETDCRKVHFDSEKHIDRPDPNNISDFVELFGGEGTAAHKAFMWIHWTPQEFVSKMDSAMIDLEEVAKLLLARLKGRGAA